MIGNIESLLKGRSMLISLKRRKEALGEDAVVSDLVGQIRFTENRLMRLIPVGILDEILEVLK